jgi:outer membrane protein assembly factor BamB
MKRSVLPFRLRSWVLVAAFGGLTLARADWPQYRGPTHDGTTPSRPATAWSAGGPKTLWKTPTPAGFSTFAVAAGRAYTLVLREVDGVNQEVCVALDASTGRELWAAPLNPARYDGGGDSGTPDNRGGDGPRSTPAVSGERVFVFDGRFKLHCLNAARGTPLWTQDLLAEWGGKMITWQNAASPVLDGDLVFVAGGGPGRSLLAFRQADGAVVWKHGTETPTHATPTVATLHGVRQVIFFTQSGLVACETGTGRELWRQPYRFSVSTAASPVVAGDIVYCSAGYGVGAGAYRIHREGDTWKSTELWRKTGNELANHWSTPVVKDGYLYGMFSFKEFGTGPLKCVELATGRVAWAEKNFGPGGVVLAGNVLVALNDRGEVVLVDPQPGTYKELARFPAVAGKCWNHPAVSDGHLLVRSTREGACLDLSPAPAQTAAR